MTSQLLPKPNVFFHSHLVTRSFFRSCSTWCFQAKHPKNAWDIISTSPEFFSLISHLRIYNPYYSFYIFPWALGPTDPSLWDFWFVTGGFCFGERTGKRFINKTNVRCNGVCTLVFCTTNYPRDLVQTLGFGIKVTSI